MQRLGQWGATAVVAVGLLVVFGWYTGIDVLTTVVPGYAPMRPNAALGLLALASGVLLVGGPRWSAGLAGVAILLGGVTLVEYAAGTSTWFDVLLPGVTVEGDSRMAQATAIAFMLLGTALLARLRGATLLARLLALTTFALAYVAVIGYVYQVRELYGVGGYDSVALHTAVCLTVLAVSLLLLDGRAGLVGLVGSRGSAGRLLRPLLPFLLIAPPVLGWLRLEAQRAGWFGTTFGVAVLVVSMTVFGTAITWWAAARLDDLDRARNVAAAKLEETNQLLETIVRDRTAALQLSSERLAALIQIAPVGILQLDAEGALLEVNDQWLTLSGLTVEQARGDGWAAAVHPDDVERLQTDWAAAAAEGRPYETSLRLVRPDGRVNWVQARTTPVRDGDRVTGHVATVTDVTAERAAQETEAAARALRAAFSSSPLGTALVTAEGTVFEANRQLAALTGRSLEELRGCPVEDLFEAPGPGAQELWVEGLLDGSLDCHRVERRLRRTGPEVWVNLSVAPIREGSTRHGLFYELEDITARRLAESRLAHLALHDPLTDLPNRALLLDRLEQALQRAARRGQGVGVLFIDLDHFKTVNDSLGHQAGDDVLAQVAARLQQHARATDTVARMGGDEFVVVCPEVTSSHDLVEIADKLRAALARPMSIGDRLAHVEASIGVAFGVGHENAEVLLSQADQAMYLAKDRGRARHEVYDSDLRGRIHRRLDTELALRGAVERGEIETWYQPIIDLQDKVVVASEALARWRRPDRGLVLPVDFISIAEDVGLIKEIGATVLAQACLAAVALEGEPMISVNVSARQFVRTDFGAVVERALALSGLPPERLWLELTESAVVEADPTNRAFRKLRERGVRIAIDDFGTGFSSFEHLRTFSVDLLKVDMTFVRDIERSAHDRAIVEGILRLADSLGLDVVAEGIESTSQRDLLQDMGCRFGQGYLFSRPSPLAAAASPYPVALPPPRVTVLREPAGD